MKSYDDLQRFKEKTQTNHIEFKDMSDQTRDADSTNWAIIKQLKNEGLDQGLGNGQRLDVPAPQPIAADVFAVLQTSAQGRAPVEPHAASRPVLRHYAAPAQQQSVATFVAAKPAAQSADSLMSSISASLKPAAPETAAPAESVAPIPPAQIAPQQAPVQHAVRPVEPAEPPRFKQLFSPTSDASLSTLSKETLLQPLLESIASCR
ncbi:cellulose biosynthesis protein BcsO [Erwinia sp. 9145]|uniref:cellulose biosynthesis protein BcsO n=1 Tax=Erwinia sp. 9145 TaxID=1500895 RepID=UPI000553D915|nr:cellulose biosynthesis protein BcsO [Erwinia sp. 9145]